MVYAIIALIFLLPLLWGIYMSRRAKAGHGEKFAKPKYLGIQVFTHGGRKRVQSDVQRSELILENRERYDHSIDRLDPRHKDYRSPDAPNA